MFLEIIKAILMGIVEGITEWLPISSTGHMILLEQVVKFNASEEFMSMFRVVIQLGAILAVVVLFWGKLWPFGLRHGCVISKPSVWQLWFKVVAATLPVLVISPLDDWMEAHFYNYITVAAMLILYGVLFLVVESRRTAPHVTHLEQITYRDALIIGVWQMLAIIPGTSRSGATIVGGLLLPGGYPLPDGLRQAPQLHLLRHLPHRPRPCGAGRGSGVCNGVKSNLDLLSLSPRRGAFLAPVRSACYNIFSESMSAADTRRKVENVKENRRKSRWKHRPSTIPISAVP